MGKKGGFFKVWAVIVIAAAVVTAQTSAIWDGTADVSWYNEIDTEFTITTAEQLAGLAKLVNGGGLYLFLNKQIKLGANIMLNDTTNWQNWEDNPPANEWIPIGTLENVFKSFVGKFDGAGFVVSGVYINATKGVQGLFGGLLNARLGIPDIEDVMIKNLGIVTSLIKFVLSDNNSVGGWPGNRIGGLAGFSEGTIINCYYAGNIIAISNVIGSVSLLSGGLVGGGSKIINSYATGNVTGTGIIGGLVGSVGEIMNSYATGNVTGTDIVGGLVGVGGNGSIITNCYAKGNVSGGSAGGLMGMIGSGNLTITDSYATGNVNGDFAGGLVGLVSRGVVGSGIMNCYAIGKVSGRIMGGGLVGFNQNNFPITIMCYYDSQTSGQSDSDGGIPRTTAQMKQRTTFIDWDFLDIWAISSEINNGYPYLRHLWCEICDEYCCGKIHKFCDICGDTDCQLNHKKCEVCGEWDCNIEHVLCNVCGKYGCEINHKRCEVCEEYDCGTEHVFCIICKKWDCKINHDATSILDKNGKQKHGIKLAVNPVSEKAEISIVLPNNERATETKIVVYDITGNAVFSTTARDNVSWDLRNTAGRFVANGTYLVIAEVKTRNGKIYTYSARLGVKR